MQFGVRENPGRYDTLDNDNDNDNDAHSLMDLFNFCPSCTTGKHLFARSAYRGVARYHWVLLEALRWQRSGS
ncbi:hypothetical protein [uncultured Thiodictyon sp.]|jgi:hypothetical protein|uniref:hypothetical protein n=1 Tax=uncultured Thiodictyon sp. TaxID=1846217 RepID=UPI0025D7090E|nr:hypothetical protein [uncultured Thiodictyon sp.]